MSRVRFMHSMLVSCGLCSALLIAALPVAAQQYDPSSYDTAPPDADTAQAPGRVARLAYLSGQVQFAPAGENDWGSVEINRPMVIGDRLLTGDTGRAVLELGDASVRIDNDSAFDFLNLTQDNVQLELSQGTLNIAVRQMDEGENFEVDTPTIAFVASTPGVYRIDNDPTGTGSMVTVFRGAGTVYGENGASRHVTAGTSYRFNDSALASVDVNGLPQPDGFDRFCETRDTNYQNYAQQQQQYIPSDMIGGDDLYQYGQWNAVPEYGNVWYPTSVPVGWAPYRFGHWAWIDPWGWTWVDNQPWGFAPFHYGRWAYIGNRWGWMPGPVNLRPVYAPALVGFIGGSGWSVSLRVGGGGPIGWFPLGPRDVYVPWFHASHRYFTNVNVTNIRNVYVNKTVINNFYGDYRAGRVPPRGGHDYAYRNLPGAVTAVPRNVFTGARPVHPAVLKLDRTQLSRTQVALRPDAMPGTTSLGLRRPTTRPLAVRGGEPFARPVVARHQPPPRPVEFATRERAIASQHGQPLTATQLQDLRRTQPANVQHRERVKLVPTVADTQGSGNLRGPRPSRPVEQPARIAPPQPGMVQRPAERSERRVAPNEPPMRNVVQPPRARPLPQQPSGALPSARFAHPGEARTLPRPEVIRPANEPQATPNGRLPVVRPLERAPQTFDQRNNPRQPAANFENQQRMRQEQLQQQRQSQEQAQRMRAQQADQQRVREQQMQQAQQRQAQMQSEREARAQQMQQQRQMQEQASRQRQMQAQMQMQNEQRAREQQMQQRQIQQMQQQREAQMQQMRMQPAQRPVERAAPRQAPQQHREPPPRERHPPESSGNLRQ